MHWHLIFFLSQPHHGCTKWAIFCDLLLHTGIPNGPLRLKKYISFCVFLQIDVSFDIICCKYVKKIDYFLYNHHRKGEANR